MSSHWSPRQHLTLARYFLKWLVIATPVGILVGSATAFFLWALDLCTAARIANPWFLFLLPLAGLVVGALYHRFGKHSEGGNNLIIEQIHEPGGGVPWLMAPLVLIGTLITHLFGGSAGREGTAVQMGGSIAGVIARAFRLKDRDVSTILQVGVAAGFGAVFGTPLTGAIFALEVLAIGRMSYGSLVPCLIGAVVGDQVCTAWHIQHTQYHVAAFGTAGGQGIAELSWLLTVKVTAAAVLFGLASVLFAELAHGFQSLFRKLIRVPMLRPVVGGLIVIALVYLVGTRDYLGLGVRPSNPDGTGVSIVTAFQPGGATGWSWFWKILFTVITVSGGFKGGEVTPLFFIGATLGNTLAGVFNAPVDLFAALGFVAVFAGATNTPLACTIMGIELFAANSPGLLGSGFVVYLAIACFVAYLVSGHSGIYRSQRVEDYGSAMPGNSKERRRKPGWIRISRSLPHG